MILIVLAGIAIMVFAMIAAAVLSAIGALFLTMAMIVLVSLMIGGGALSGAFITLLAGALLLWGSRALARRRPRAHFGQPPVEHTTPARRRTGPTKTPVTRDPALADAFDALAGHADWARSRVAVARASCDRFLLLADRAPLHGEATELAILIRKRIPEHVDEALSKLDLATSAEARALLDDTVLTVEKVGARAERLRDSLMSDETATLNVQRSHLSRRSDSEPFSLN